MPALLELAVRALEVFGGFDNGRDQIPLRGEVHGVKSTPTASKTSIPDYFQTTDHHFAGPTQTGAAPWLAQTNLAPFAGVSYIPNAPLETQIPVPGNTKNQNIFQSLANLSPYFPHPDGFGVNEYPIPPGSNVSWLNMVHRHGSRYPEFSGRAPERTLGAKIMAAKGNFTAHGPLSFLNSWEFLLGAEILVPIGKQELFNSGTLHYYQYGHLYPNNGSKIIVRSTTQQRMLESAEYFLAGFFGLGWTGNATLELVIEEDGLNNTMAGYKGCENSNWDVGYNATMTWANVYLQDAHKRITENLEGNLDWTVEDTYNAQALCAYETVGLGFSSWCGFFTFEEWEGFEYSLDVGFHAGVGWASPVGRAIGIGYVHEVLARLHHHTITKPTAQINLTLDNNTHTFPTHQTLNLDFSHDANIISILVAFGLTQFSGHMPLTHIPPSRNFILSHLEPFAGRLDIELIHAPAPVNPNRTVPADQIYLDGGGPTNYVRFVLNQRTIPLGKSLEECGDRDDGWCEIDAFYTAQKRQIERVDFDFACFGEYDRGRYGDVTDGRPPVDREVEKGEVAEGREKGAE
ncbi:phosphoglycerate mutase-like protein [Aaosphaeria arxii CBS 175.79]|uniref:3-phytase n=1 Tax=Aaosphaeria arxii CBS 175.79 TaxID=1450172 RepID=A0A6A5XY06_9PLEO|nr:phosphoglycerate mutase-like protein [Aaosphaeria arxii CBS 175.79]KAF2017591.1 phosphoglycerate mutase-like protein [Aaosphaeria arxii CBS 175.79]